MPFRQLCNVYPEDVDCDGDSNQRQQNQGQHSSIGVHHTWIFCASPAAAEEGDNEHEGTCDSDPGGVISIADPMTGTFVFIKLAYLENVMSNKCSMKCL